jgi:gamma-glutamyl-gamma-aminobutyraldehyde dehydrogenase
MQSVQTIDWAAQAIGVQSHHLMLIDGSPAEAQDGARFTVIGPRDGRVIADLPLAETADLNLAVVAARRAFNAGVWSNRSPTERKAVLLRLADLIERDRAKLALLDTLCMGAPIKMTYEHCVQWGINSFRWYAEALDKTYDEVAPAGPGVLAMVVREPVGVVGLVLPWNWPTGMIGWKVAPALAMGNSVVLKPDEQTSLSALHIAQLALDAGVPSGVFNVVTGGPALGEAIGRHPDIDALAFTGSTAVGARFLCYSGESNSKPVYLECGGKSPNIIFDDAPDVAAAASAAAFAIFMNCGQVCAAGSRLLVHNSIRDRVLDGVETAAAIFAPGDPLTSSTIMGPMAKREQYERVLRYIDDGTAEGAQLKLGGRTSQAVGGGFFLQPTIFECTDHRLRIAREEIFGPVLCVLGFDDEEEALRIANDSSYGLAAAVWTQHFARAHRMSRALRAGSVSVNNYNGDAGDLTVPFGGYKASGYGRDKSLHALDKYVQLKTLWMRFD